VKTTLVLPDASEQAAKEVNDVLLEEDEVITFMCKWLKANDWSVDSRCFGSTHGIDIVATRNGKTLLLEAKGARAGMKAKNRKREKFDPGQIKDHLGKAIVKALELKAAKPDASVGIVQPDAPAIRKVLDPILTELLALKIVFFLISGKGEVTHFPKDWVKNKPWMKHQGALKDYAGELEQVKKVIEEEFEQINLDDWK
jgi:hypothetical protein